MWRARWGLKENGGCRTVATVRAISSGESPPASFPEMRANPARARALHAAREAGRHDLARRFAPSPEHLRTMSLTLNPIAAVSKVRAPVAACVKRCLGDASSSAARSTSATAAGARASTSAATAGFTPGAYRAALAPWAVADPRAAAPPPAPAPHRRSLRAFSTAAGASPADVEDAVRDVQRRLGVTLSEEPTVPTPPPVVVVISGPSGVGKDSGVRRLQSLRPDLHMVVTATDRPPRPGEQDGVDYHFLTTRDFERMIADGELVEHAVVYGQYKGIPKQQIREKLAANTDVILRLDVQGAATVRDLMPDATFVFVAAESEAALARRLAGRGTETPEELAGRIQTAREELARVGEFDYVVINEDGGLDDAAERLAAVVDAERTRRGRRRVAL